MPPRPTYPRRPVAAPRGFPVTRGVWWFAVVVIGVLTVAAFETGHAVGHRVVARRARAAEPTTVAAVTKPAAAKPSPPPAPTPDLLSAPVPPAKQPDPRDRTPPTREPMPKTAEPERAEPKKSEPKKVEPKAEPVADVRFDTGVLPVFQSKCVSCHGTLSKRGGLDLRTLAAVTRGGNSGPGVVPGRPSDSPVWETVRTGQMPPPNKAQLTPAEKQLILAWVAGGAK